MRALLPLVVIATVCHSVAAIVDFSFYPQLAQNCLYQSSNSSKCDEGTVSATNNCLCTNGGSFITNTAKCLGKEDPNDVLPVYQTMKTACTDSKTPIKITQDEFVKAAAVSSTTTTPATTRASDTATVTQTITSTASPAPGDKDKEGEEPKKGLSAGALAGIVGGGVAALAVVGGLIFFLVWRRRRRDGEESHPMLPQHGVGMNALPPQPAQPGMPSPGMPYHAGAANEWPDDRKWRPSPNPSDHRPSAGFSWETPYDPYATPKFAAPTPPPPPPPAAYELVGSDSHVPAEVPGSPPIMEMDGTPVPQPQDRFRPYRG